jgi:hypothetical protein
VRVAIALLLTLTLAVAACERDGGGEAVPGVRLGMSPRDVRDRFEKSGKGTWKTNVGGGAPGASGSDDTVLEWIASTETTPATRARFEFHLGMLVAVRAHVREGVARERIELTSKTVTVRSPEGGGTEVTILARDCPTHHQEAESLAARAR